MFCRIRIFLSQKEVAHAEQTACARLYLAALERLKMRFDSPGQYYICRDSKIYAEVKALFILVLACGSPQLPLQPTHASLRSEDPGPEMIWQSDHLWICARQIHNS